MRGGDDLRGCSRTSGETWCRPPTTPAWIAIAVLSRPTWEPTCSVLSRATTPGAAGTTRHRRHLLSWLLRHARPRRRAWLTRAHDGCCFEAPGGAGRRSRGLPAGMKPAAPARGAGAALDRRRGQLQSPAQPAVPLPARLRHWCGNTIATWCTFCRSDPSTRTVALAVPMDGGARIHTLARRDEPGDGPRGAAIHRPAPARAEPGGAPAEAAEGADVVLIGFPLGARLGLYLVTHRGVIAAIAPMVLLASAPPPWTRRRCSVRGERSSCSSWTSPRTQQRKPADRRAQRPVLGVGDMVTVKGARKMPSRRPAASATRCRCAISLRSPRPER